MKIVCQNLNGIRSSHSKWLLHWIEKNNPDIFCVQEVRASKDQIPAEIMWNVWLFGWEMHINAYDKYRNCGNVPGYAGTAVFSKSKPKFVKNWFGKEEFDLHGRMMLAEYDKFFLINTYVPNWWNDNSKVDYKLQYMDELLRLVNELKLQKEVILLWDFNVAHTEIDLSQPKQNKDRTWFLLSEREKLTEFIDSGFVDVLRIFYPTQSVFSWFSYRAKNQGLDIWWRFDYVFVTPWLVDNVKSFEIHRYLDHSDHCPLIMEIDI